MIMNRLVDILNIMFREIPEATYTELHFIYCVVITIAIVITTAIVIRYMVFSNA
jgi:hypothetical protein